jgi:Tol biopolymer transport system component
MNLDGTGIQQVTRFNAVTTYASDAVIGNASWIAFVRTDASRDPQVWIVRPDGTGLRQLSDDGASANSPSLSADGASLAFIQNGQEVLAWLSFTTQVT